MNTTENYVCATFSGNSSDFVSAQCICRVNADTDNVAFFDRLGIDLRESFVNESWVAEAQRCCRCQHILPTRRDHGGTERDTTGIDQMNLHGATPFGFCNCLRSSTDVTADTSRTQSSTSRFTLKLMVLRTGWKDYKRSVRVGLNKATVKQSS